MKRYLVHNGRSELTSCLMRVGGWGQGGGEESQRREEAGFNSRMFSNILKRFSDNESSYSQ